MPSYDVGGERYLSEPDLKGFLSTTKTAHIAVQNGGGRALLNSSTFSAQPEPF
jgi:hypothetical protein